MIKTMALLGVLFSVGTASAGGMVVQSSDGTSGTITDLKNGLGIYSDSHGNSGTVVDLGGESRQLRFSSPVSEPATGTTRRLGVVPEPITPAPVLPFGPRVSPLLTPGAPQTPPVLPPSTSAPGTGFWRR